MVVGVTMAVVAMMTTVTTATMTAVVARAHGAVVEVHSQPGAGATFTLLVPVTLAPSHLAGRPLRPPTHLDTITGSAP